MHVAVVGAGIIGVTLAGALARRGVTVTLLDSGAPGSGTSGSSLAWLNSNQKLPRTYHDLSVRAIEQWREIGESPWYVPAGSLSWAVADEERDALARRLERLRDWGYAAEELTGRQAAELEPALRIPGGALIALFPGEAFLQGDRAVEALLARATADGVRLVVTGGEVTFEVRGDRVAAAVLPDRSRVRADVYVGCAGRWTPRLFEPLGVSVPLVDADDPGSAAPCLVVRTSGPAPVGRVVNAPGLSLRPLLEGGLQLETGGTPAAEVPLRRAGEIIEGFEAGTARHHLCVRPLPVDGHPIVGWLPRAGNAYVSVTHSGMTLAPVLARLAAAEIAVGDQWDELRAYRPTRFGQRLLDGVVDR